MKHLKITKNDADQRLDRFLGKYLPKMKSSMIQKYIRKKRIKVNKKRAKPQDTLREGDIVNIYIYDEVLEKYQDKREYKAENFDLDIIYEDEHILVINKDRGVLTHAASKEDYGKNLTDYMISYLIKTGEYLPRIEKSFTPAFANRLDRNTSGIVVAGKDSDALKKLNDIFKDREITKIYETFVQGKIKDQEINLSLEKNEQDNQVVISSEGKKARTKVKCIENYKNYSLIEVDLITGRTHQIRAHLGAIGHPVYGDTKYGGKKQEVAGQILHCRSVIFHEIDGELSYLSGKKFTAKRPAYFNKILNGVQND
ncbi:MAG: RluA family pseudouridine synthase [Tissierellia bacterium]|nr:RluA family pseudouridine synthase [Tissierellia bacterium]